ncbi:MAG: N-acetylglucosamine-6-phosphate deacetylase [Candidatus Nanopelagicales bacterium]
MSTLLRADRVVAPDRVLSRGWVAVEDDRIVAVGEGPPTDEAGVIGPAVDLGDAMVVAGFVDIHVHGGGGATFGTGAEQDRRAIAFHRRHGTTTLQASLVSAPVDQLVRQVRDLAELVADGDLAGVHLEGPWLSPARRGAHDPRFLRDPDPHDVEALLGASPGAVGMVTLAPELRGGLDAVRAVVAAGARAAVGHTDADYGTVRAAREAGASVATHLFNAMPPLGHRSPGPVTALLDDPGCVVELICDGVHLHPAVVHLAVAHAGAGRVALITDAMAAAGVGDGDFRLGSLAVRVTDGVARLVDGGAIAGSTLTMDAAFRYVVDVVGVDPVSASAMASAVPAAVLGLDGDRGRLAAGQRADLVVLSPDLQVRRVMLAGAWVADT